MSKKSASIKVYHGYGHTHDLVVYGHVFRFRAKTKQDFSNNFFVNVIHIFKLFVIKPYPFLNVSLNFNGQIVHTKTIYDGFFKFEWQANKYVTAGWHKVEVRAIDDNGVEIAKSEGKIFVPHVTQFAFISDIDDTVMISHSSKIARRLRELFIKNPRTRKTFPTVQKHYQLLANAHTPPEQPNPFFYVSSSEWNLYDYLVETFRFNKFPEGAFLLNQLKQWQHLFKTGKTGHEGKLLKVMRIINTFPNQRFIFFGDNSQQDPTIYYKIAEKYGENIMAVYIRNVRKSKAFETKTLLAKLEQKNIHTCFFEHNDEAVAHSKKIGLIT